MYLNLSMVGATHPKGALHQCRSTLNPGRIWIWT